MCVLLLFILGTLRVLLVACRGRVEGGCPSFLRVMTTAPSPGGAATAHGSGEGAAAEWPLEPPRTHPVMLQGGCQEGWGARGSAAAGDGGRRLAGSAEGHRCLSHWWSGSRGRAILLSMAGSCLA